MESSNGNLRDELLDRDIFYTLQEVQRLTEQYRQTYNRIRPQNSLRYRHHRHRKSSCLPCPSPCRTNITGRTKIGGRSRSSSSPDRPTFSRQSVNELANTYRYDGGGV